MNAVMDGDLDKLQQQMDKGRESCVITPEPGKLMRLGLFGVVIIDWEANACYYGNA